jgi:protein-S-isoprenylcysteine O-methyltransferase Ste14
MTERERDVTFLENKIPPPIVCALFALMMRWLSTELPIVSWDFAFDKLAIIFICILGFCFCVAGILAFIKEKTTTNPLKPETASSLVSSGVYGISRNPMYLGLALFLVAFAVFLSSLTAFAGVAGFVIYMNEFQIKPEEKAIEGVFGHDYIEYKNKVRRWV